MTSSLVGSEMCIRDRFWRVGKSWSLHVDVTESPHPASRGSTSWHLRAVSYTHLTLPTICSV
eukprot:10394414-Prorocentrum_lima.AAC.1